MAPESARRVFERDRHLLAIGIPLKFTQYTVNSGWATLEGGSLASHDFFLPYLTVVAGVDAPAETKGAARPGSVVLAPEHLADAVEALGRVADLTEKPLRHRRALGVRQDRARPGHQRAGGCAGVHRRCAGG